jgi:hypothetical protein
MKRVLVVICVVAFIFTCFPAISFGDFVLIDDFESGSGSVVVGPEQTGSVELDIFGIDPTQTINGERRIFADGQATEIDSQLSVTLFDPGNGNPSSNDVFSFNSFGSVGYQWGQNDDLNLALDQLDLVVASLVSNLGAGEDFETTIQITLTSGRGSASETTESVSKAEIDTDQSNLTISWLADEFSIVDLADVDLIELGFEGDFFVGELESFSVNAVPEPSAATFLISCLLLTSRRRSKT